MRAGASIVAIAFVVGACSFGALDGFSGGPEANADDAGSALDGATTTDAPNATDAAGPLCATRTPVPVVCSDFEQGTSPFAVTATGGGGVTVDDGGTNGSKGVRFSIAAQAAGGDSACLTLGIPKGSTTVIMEMDVRVDQIGVDDFDLFTSNAGTPEIGVHAAGLAILEIEEDSSSGTAHTTSSARLDTTFHHLRFAVTKTATAAHAELSFDGALVATREAAVAALANATELQIGDCNVGNSRAWTVHVDNVVIDVR